MRSTSRTAGLLIVSFLSSACRGPRAEPARPTRVIPTATAAAGLEPTVREPVASTLSTGSVGTPSEPAHPPATGTTAVASTAVASTAAPSHARPTSGSPSDGGSGQIDPAALPDALAGVHFAPGIPAADIYGPGRTGWAVELAYAADGDPLAVGRRMADLHARGYRPILRLDHARGQNVPPTGDADALRGYLDFAVRAVEGSGRSLRFVVVGNEPNIDEAGAATGRNTECRLGRETCRPEAYAAVYRAARAALRPLGAYAVVAGVSPGTDEHPARWVGGPEYLSALLALLAPGEVDGIALHAYGLEAEPVPGLPSEPLDYFEALVVRQLAAVDGAGHAATPVFLTEMNAYTYPEPAFVASAYGWLDEQNGQRRGDVLCAVWFVYEGGGSWEHVALTRWPDVLAAFRTAAGRYPAGR